MCAINGIVDTRGRSTEERVADTAAVQKMLKVTEHRGPDGHGQWQDTFATLGSNRLAVLDLSAGASMPMLSQSGRYVIVYNGEVYNFKELRKELASYQCTTDGDTEVILAAYERWGSDAFAKLRGMFAIALWDMQEHTLVLARDHSGIKPLYYRTEHDGARITFSSEIKGLLTANTVPRTISREALESYLKLRYVPEPITMIEGVLKLPPGTFAVIKAGSMALSTFAKVPLQPLVIGSPRDIAKQVEVLVDRAVASELVSDRPVGLFLSGGLDSTIVLDAATKAAGTVQTFSLRFDVSKNEQSDKFNADADLAVQTAKHYGAKHTEVLLTEEEFVRLLPEAMYYLDQPIANATAIAQLFLAKEARKHIVVALAGDGGDELFGGYPRYRLSRFMDIYRIVPRPLRALLNAVSSSFKKLDTPPGIERVVRFMFEKEATLKQAIYPEFISDLPADTFERHYLTGRGEHDFTQLFMDADRRSWLVDEALARTDTMTMAASLEARVPLLQFDIVEYASRIPSTMRAGLFTNKKILRAAFAKRLPKHVLNAKKRGFFSPTAKWMRRPAMLALVRETLSAGYHPGTDALLNFPAVQKMLEDHVSGRTYAMNTLWTLVTLRLWAKQYDASL